MSGDSKDFKGDSDDLLSQLLDLEDVISNQKSDEEKDSKTEVLSKDETPEPDRNDQTEVLSSSDADDSKSESSFALDDLLKDETDAAPSESVEFFSQQLEEKPQSFEEELEHTILDQAKPLSDNPFAEEKREKTIVLDSPVEEEPAFEEQANYDKTDFLPKEGLEDVFESAPTPEQEKPVEEADPIEAALAEFSNEQGEDLSAASISSVRPKASDEKPASTPELEVEDLFTAPEAQPQGEMAAEDFADVFQSGPIQVPQQTVGSKKWKSSKKWVALAAGVFIPLAVLSVSAYKFWSETGILGWRMNGLALEKVYRPPSEEVLANYQKTVKEAAAARLQDDPSQMEVFVPRLEQILRDDERNLEAAYELLEQSGLLISWKGIQTPYPAKYEQVLSKVKDIESRIENPKPSSQKIRAKVFRSFEVGEMPAALVEYEKFVSDNQALTDDNKALLGELYFRRGDAETAKEFLKDLGKDRRRAQFYKALAFENRSELRELAKSSYLPAEVELEAADADKSLRENLSSFDRLLAKVKDFPWLAARVQAKLGDLYQGIGEGERAREYWKEIVAKSPEDFQTWRKLAQSYERDAEWEEALNAYRAAIKAGGLQKQTTLRFVRLMRTRLKVVEALDVIDQAIQKFPQAPEFYYEKGETQLAIYQDEQAKKSFETSLSFDKAYEPSILSLAQLAVKQQDFQVAQDLFSKIPESSPNYSKALMGLGRLALTKRELSEGKRYFALSIKTNPKNEEAYSYLTSLLLRDEEDQKALFLAEQGIENSPRSPVVHLAKAKVLHFQGKYEEAREQIRPFLKTHNHLLPLVLEHAEIYIDQKEFAKAREVLDEFASKEVSEPEIAYLRAKLNYEDEGAQSSPVIGSKEAAWRYIQTALNSSPQNEEYLELQARIALTLDERLQAAEIANRLLQLYPDNAGGYEVKGDVYAISGDYERALQSYSAAQSRTRFHGSLYRKIAGVYRQQGLSAKAIQYYEKLVRWYPSDASAYLELGKLYNDDGRYSKAVDAFRRAAQIRPSLSEAYYYMGFIQKEMGDHGNAVRNFERYLSLEPNGVEAATVKDEIYFLRNGTSAN